MDDATTSTPRAATASQKRPVGATPLTGIRAKLATSASAAAGSLLSLPGEAPGEAPGDVPVACSLDAAGQQDRQQEFADVISAALVQHQRTATGLALTFRDGGDLRASLDDLIAREQECCPFFAFRLESEAGTLRLHVGAPPEAQEFIDHLFPIPAAAVQQNGTALPSPFPPAQTPIHIRVRSGGSPCV